MDFFRVQLSPAANVIELLLPESVDAMEFDRINESMLSALDGRAAERWVVDLSAVNYLGSSMLGLIVNIRQQVKSAGGKLVLCGLSGRLTQIIHTCSMERLFTIAKNRADALKSVAR